MARRRQTRLRMPSGVIATYTAGSWKTDPPDEAELAQLNHLMWQLDKEGALGASNPFPPMTIAEAARDRLGATILEVEPPEPEGTYPPGTVF